MKRLGVILLRPGWDASSSEGYPQIVLRYTSIHLGGERHCESKVKSKVPCPRTQHRCMPAGNGLNPDRSIRGRVHWLWGHRATWWMGLENCRFQELVMPPRHLGIFAMSLVFLCYIRLWVQNRSTEDCLKFLALLDFTIRHNYIAYVPAIIALRTKFRLSLQWSIWDLHV